MLRRLAGTAGLFLLALTNLAFAQSYGQHVVNIKVATVVIDSARGAVSNQPLNYAPHVWFNLDSNKLVKPAGWSLTNPRATTQVSQAIVNRWGGLVADVGGPVPVLGAGLTKSNAAYWEVRLSEVGDQQLSDYDALLLSAYGYTNLNSVERDKLRKFVDQGGVLWIDVASSTNFSNAQVNTFGIPFQTTNVFGGAALTDADIFHPLMSTPYALNLANLEQMRLDTASFAAPIVLQPIGLGNHWPILSWLESDYFMHFTPIATSVGRPSVLVGKLGNGCVVVTTSEYAMAINRVATGGGTYNSNNRFEGMPPTYDRTAQLAAKFIVNMLSLSGGAPQPGGGPRNSRGNPIDLQPPLINKFGATDVNILKQQGAVVYKGLLVVSSGQQVRVFDANPRSDLDGDGNPDDGIQDYSLGDNSDLLWESAPLGTTISAPVCVEVPGSNRKDQILVVGANGVVYELDAFFLTNGRINPFGVPQNPGYTVNPPGACTSSLGLPGPGPYAPTVHDGLVYVATTASAPTGGVVYVVDPVSEDAVKTGPNNWFVGAVSGPQAFLPEFTGSPTIGYIPVQDASGAFDRVMYLPGRPNGANGPTGTASITSLWMGVRGESPGPGMVTMAPTTMTVVTRAGRASLPVYLESGVPASALAKRALGVKLTMLYANGDPFTSADMATYFTGNVSQPGTGILEFELTGTPLPVGATPRLDYSIDWGTGNAPLTSLIVRGQVYLPDNYNGVPRDDRRRIIGNIAMSPRGTLYCVSSSEKETDPDLDGGSFYAIREDIGRGGFRLLTRYSLFPRHMIPLNQGTPVSYDELFTDTDPLLSVAAGGVLNGRFNHFTFMSAPAIRDNVVYVVASARKTNPGFPFAGFIPYSILMAFKGEPEPPEIKIGDIPDTFSLRQFDMDRSVSHANPTSPNDVSQGQFSYSRGEGIVRFDNLMTSNRGPMSNAFSTSQPVIIRRPNAPDQIIDPDSLGNKWSPLLWYTVLHGVQATGAPTVTGSSVFVPGSSILPNLSSLPAIQISGIVQAYNTDISPTDRFLGGDNKRPWNHQLYQLLFAGLPNPIQPNPHVLWPQMSGVRDFEDYQVRVRQTKLGNSNTAFGIVGGDGVLGAWGNQGVYSFTRADFIVLDENRLSRFDANGNPLYVINTTSSAGANDQGSVGTLKPLVRPVRAYPVGENDLVVVDAGANRVARLDLSGRELRSIGGFKLDSTAIPEGFKANEPLTLSSPRDAAVFNTFELNGSQYWVHYLIADTGNKRLVEIVDKYYVNANRQITTPVLVGGDPQIGVLYWHSPTNFSGKDFDYNSISRVYEPVSGLYYYCAGIGNASPTRVNSGLDSPAGGNPGQARESVAGNGGIVILDPTDPSKNLVINEVMVPDIQQDTFFNFSTGTYNSPFRPAHMKRLSNVNSVTSRVIRNGPSTLIALMFTDATGVYEVAQPVGGGTWDVRWMLPNEAYKAIRQTNISNPPNVSPLNALDLRATYARRLDNGDVLLVNGYLGKTRVPSDFNGEVIQIDGSIDPINIGYDLMKRNLGFDFRTIVFQLPPIRGARGLMLPVFADRR